MMATATAKETRLANTPPCRPCCPVPASFPLQGSNAELAKLKELQALYLDLVRTKAQETVRSRGSVMAAGEFCCSAHWNH